MRRMLAAAAASVAVLALTACGGTTAPAEEGPVSCLGQWPVQLKLVPVEAPFFDGARLLVSASTAVRRRLAASSILIWR